MRPGLISSRSARKMSARRKRRGGYNYGGTSQDGQSLHADEGRDRNGTGMPPGMHLNEEDYQGGAAMYGRRVSSGGGAGAEYNPSPANHISASRNRRAWPAGAQISSSNPHTGNTRMKAPMSRSNGNPGNWYTGGRGNSRG